ncbi:MAG: carbohydrate ABC transporter permease [Chloroflexi bacterium]|nr:carbohydrate ABC transporter permease [Chloroflexota bacterium]MCA2000282.1 carbohydrate ABC transporter permease [Chloroflexota bacterium]
MSKPIYKTILDVVAYAFLIFGALTMLLPFLWMISVSLRVPAEQFSRNIVPNPLTFQNYFDLFRDLPDDAFFYLTFNSFKLSILTVFGQVLTCAMAAFVFAIVKFKGRDFLFALLVATLMIPPQVSLIPNFIIFKYLGWIGTQLPLIVPAFWGGAFGTFLLRQYFLTIPRDLVDAARMDGASLFDIFWRIYLPLSKPAVAALSIFVFKDAWNDLLHPLVYLPTNMHKTTLTVGLAFFQQQLQMGGKFTVLMAGAFLSILPLLIIFFIAQKQFIEGIALSGVKR